MGVPYREDGSRHRSGHPRLSFRGTLGVRRALSSRRMLRPSYTVSVCFLRQRLLDEQVTCWLAERAPLYQSALPICSATRRLPLARRARVEGAGLIPSCADVRELNSIRTSVLCRTARCIAKKAVSAGCYSCARLRHLMFRPLEANARTHIIWRCYGA